MVVVIRGQRKSPIQPKETIFDIARGFQQVSEIDKALRDLHTRYEGLLAEQSDLSNKQIKELLREIRTEADRKLAQIVHAAAENNGSVFKRLLSSLQAHIDDAVAALEQAKVIQKGDRGDDGKDAPIPVRGKDYFTSEDVKIMVQMVLNRIRQPEDGRDAMVTDEMLSEAIAKYLKKKKISHKDIGDLEEVIAPVRHVAAMRGGGDTVAAGTNVTITTSNGVKTINAASGAGTWSTPPETPNGSTTVFTVSAEPTEVVADGTTMFDGAGYTYAALQITFTNPPTSYVRYR